MKGGGGNQEGRKIYQGETGNCFCALQVFTRRRVGWMISLTVIVEPGSNLDQIGHVGRNTALEQGRIASYDVLITHFALVRLQNN